MYIYIIVYLFIVKLILKCLFCFSNKNIDFRIYVKNTISLHILFTLLSYELLFSYLLI